MQMQEIFKQRYLLLLWTVKADNINIMIEKG